MRCNTTWKTRTLVAALALVLALGGGLAHAKKPVPPPPPDPTPVDTGTIYFTASDTSGPAVYTMDPDGSGKTALPPAVFPFTDPYTPCEPSQALHRGERWFLQLRDVGGGHRELFAVNESATVIKQLTVAPSVEAEPMSVGWSPCLRWSTRGGVLDGKVSYLAKESSGGVVVDWGIYVLDVDPDDLTHHVAGLPSRLPLEVIRSPNGTINAHYDWSSDGNSVVYRLPLPTWGLWTASAPSWTPVQLVSSDEDCRRPSWVAATDRILFLVDGVWESIDSDGTNRHVVLTPGASETIGSCEPSPNGTHLIYSLFDGSLNDRRHERQGWNEIMRAALDGSGETNLTEDIAGSPFPLGWR